MSQRGDRKMECRKPSVLSRSIRPTFPWRARVWSTAGEQLTVAKDTARETTERVFEASGGPGAFYWGELCGFLFRWFLHGHHPVSCHVVHGLDDSGRPV